MPRKQNGFGNAKSFATPAVNNRIDKGKGKGAAGFYPSNRRYGSSVNRTVIEQYDLNSDWVKWRKGMEFYYQASWYRLQIRNEDYNPFDPDSQEYIPLEINSKLYQGTAGEIDVKFDGYRFATKNSDTANHYVIKRQPIDPESLGVITEVRNDELLYPENYKAKEIWATGEPSPKSFMLRQMIGERLTDGETAATLSWILTDQEHPAIFIGKALPDDLTVVTVSVPKEELLQSQLVQEAGGDFNVLIGELGYIRDFYLESNIEPANLRVTDDIQFSDFDNFFTVEATDSKQGVFFSILDQNTLLPPTLLDLKDLETVFKTDDANTTLSGTFVYNKSLYQRFYGKQYLTAEVVQSEVNELSYVVFPFTIQSTKVVGDRVELTSVPFTGELKLYAPIGDQAVLVFEDHSFTRQTVDLNQYGEYYHADDRDEKGNPLPLWQLLDTDVDPWQSAVFKTGNPLVPAVTYACSCPSCSHAQLRMPETTEGPERRKINRQRRYPLPTTKGLDRFTEGALAQVAGVAESWATRDYQRSYKQCKHTIAAQFIERIKTKEPNSYPSVSTRIKFEAKLKEEIADVGAEFQLSYERAGITILELIFAMALSLNMDDAELAYVILNTNY